ncbi:TetR/AcrR family transcriptional regulator [Phenylobacterium sp.]|uniref:TetR/AcrR family transcriptional regulator n=1 Tax=Phenylobacterium sp. TaxID=1871053 RepID=UPI002DEC3E04|nr:TetR/AcrR family transcriptional regulator [Phenylobacterium sp.]
MQGRPRLDRDTRREAILDVAQDVFLEQGFAAASMSEIAARLGGSKGTLYNYFKSKDELFEAYVQRRCVLNLEEIYGVDDDAQSVRDTLSRVARAYLHRVLSDDNLRHFRLIIAEAERSPEFGRMFYEMGPRRGEQRLAERMSAWAEKGLVAAPDPERAARHFLGLCQNRYFKARLCNYVPELSDAQIEAETTAAIDTFLRAFGPERA